MATRWSAGFAWTAVRRKYLGLIRVSEENPALPLVIGLFFLLSPSSAQNAVNAWHSALDKLSQCINRHVTEIHSYNANLSTNDG